MHYAEHFIFVFFLYFIVYEAQRIENQWNMVCCTKER